MERLLESQICHWMQSKSFLALLGWLVHGISTWLPYGLHQLMQSKAARAANLPS